MRVTPQCIRWGKCRRARAVQLANASGYPTNYPIATQRLSCARGDPRPVPLFGLSRARGLDSCTNT